MQVFESDSKTGNVVVADMDNVVLKIVSCNIQLPTVASSITLRFDLL